jgi:hypothetical protein
MKPFIAPLSTLSAMFFFVCGYCVAAAIPPGAVISFVLAVVCMFAAEAGRSEK